MKDSSVPIATKWLLDSVGEIGRSVVDSVFLIYCPKTQNKGTGFLIKEGYIITNYHVVEGCEARDIVAISSYGTKIKFKNIIVDMDRDLAALEPIQKIEGGLELSDSNRDLKVGMLVSTWGYPLGYNGPAPLLTTGYLSGFSDVRIKDNDTIVKHLVINGAFNPGNSGGPLLISNDNKVIAVVVSKHVPMSKFLKSALQALEDQRSGFQFTATNGKGNTRKYSEAQIVAELLKHHQKLTQVVIGEAIALSELKSFLRQHKW